MIVLIVLDQNWRNKPPFFSHWIEIFLPQPSIKLPHNNPPPSPPILYSRIQCPFSYALKCSVWSFHLFTFAAPFKSTTINKSNNINKQSTYFLFSLYTTFYKIPFILGRIAAAYYFLSRPWFEGWLLAIAIKFDLSKEPTILRRTISIANIEATAISGIPD